jgi:hypothetical protein
VEEDDEAVDDVGTISPPKPAGAGKPKKFSLRKATEVSVEEDDEAVLEKPCGAIMADSHEDLVQDRKGASSEHHALGTEVPSHVSATSAVCMRPARNDRRHRKRNGRRRSSYFSLRHADADNETSPRSSQNAADSKPTVEYVLGLFKSMHVEADDDDTVLTNLQKQGFAESATEENSPKDVPYADKVLPLSEVAKDRTNPGAKIEVLAMTGRPVSEKHTATNSVESICFPSALHGFGDSNEAVAPSPHAVAPSLNPLTSSLCGSQPSVSAEPVFVAGEEEGGARDPEKMDGDAALARLQDIYKEKARVQELYKAAGQYISTHSPDVEAERRERMEFYMGLGMQADEARLLVHNLMYSPERESQRQHMVELYTGLGVGKEEANALVQNLMML